MPGAVLAGFATLDIVVHGWDLARATGQPASFDEGLVAHCLGFAAGDHRRDPATPDRPGGPCADDGAAHRPSRGVHGPPTVKQRGEGTLEQRFWNYANPLLTGRDVSRSTMMGLPCLRLKGAFFASFDRRTGDLLVKLPEERVKALVQGGRAQHFAPAGRTFREWAAVPRSHSRSWPRLLREALEFVGPAGNSSSKSSVEIGTAARRRDVATRSTR